MPCRWRDEFSDTNICRQHDESFDMGHSKRMYKQKAVEKTQEGLFDLFQQSQS